MGLWRDNSSNDWNKTKLQDEDSRLQIRRRKNLKSCTGCGIFEMPAYGDRNGSVTSTRTDAKLRWNTSTFCKRILCDSAYHIQLGVYLLQLRILLHRMQLPSRVLSEDDWFSHTRNSPPGMELENSPAHIPPPVPILIQINTIHTHTSYFPKNHFNIILLSGPKSSK